MVTIATVNVNGIRAAYRKGMADWLENSGSDIVTLQEVRAERSDLDSLIGDGWHIAHDEASQKGRAGVAVLSRTPLSSVSTTLGPQTRDTAGRWLEAVTTTPGGVPITVVSAYVHSGEAGTEKQDAKYAFLEVMDKRMAELAASGHTVVTGDLNIGHRTLDIKNWKGNIKNAGFLPEERSFLDKWLGHEDSPDYNTGAGNRFVDIGRKATGEVEGPYSWWSYRGKAFDTDTGWRIDYQLATPDIAHTLSDYRIDRAPSYDTRWSDHAPVVATYAL
jgi:exodeoxyribonuclease-3